LSLQYYAASLNYTRKLGLPHVIDRGKELLDEVGMEVRLLFQSLTLLEVENDPLWNLA